MVKHSTKSYKANVWHNQLHCYVTIKKYEFNVVVPKLHPPSLREIDFPEHILNHSPRALGSVSLSVSNILPMHQQGVLLRTGAMYDAADFTVTQLAR